MATLPSCVSRTYPNAPTRHAMSAAPGTFSRPTAQRFDGARPHRQPAPDCPCLLRGVFKPRRSVWARDASGRVAWSQAERPNRWVSGGRLWLRSAPEESRDQVIPQPTGRSPPWPACPASIERGELANTPIPAAMRLASAPRAGCTATYPRFRVAPNAGRRAPGAIQETFHVKHELGGH
jgi:hypothetical protein